MVGDKSYCRRYIQRGRKQKDGKLEPERMKKLMLTLLMCKLGCNHLASTYAYVNGGMSHRQARRHLADGTILNFKCCVTSCLDRQVKNAIEKNMEDAVYELVKSSTKRLVHLLVDGVAVDEKIDGDTNQVPHRFVGLCLHNHQSQYVGIDDVTQIESQKKNMN